MRIISARITKKEAGISPQHFYYTFKVIKIFGYSKDLSRYLSQLRIRYIILEPRAKLPAQPHGSGNED